MFKSLACVFLGGGLGAGARFLFYQFNLPLFKDHGFIYTYLVNILGCFAFGVLLRWIPHESSVMRNFILVGFLGGFTTFSTYSVENFNLLKNAQWMWLSVNMFSQAIVGVLAVSLGVWLGELIS